MKYIINQNVNLNLNNINISQMDEPFKQYDNHSYFNDISDCLRLNKEVQYYRAKTPTHDIKRLKRNINAVFYYSSI